ncbi:MAG: rRNA maturation RNase YbeY [Verrucomicrobiota bacterium]|nr:rRNA maturation RNase YbeY [Verrucomicrobiota bacterium]
MLHNNQRHLRLRPPVLRKLAKSLVVRAFPPEDGPAPFSNLALVLTDDVGMPEYKERCFGQRIQTDVISLSYAAIPGVCPSTAEIILNVERAAQEGAHRAGGVERELALYLAHGIDHLAGHEDDTPSRRRTMRRRETAWLDAAPAAYAGLVAS